MVEGRAVSFSKYHGLGNDFIIVNADDMRLNEVKPSWVQKVCSRRFGVGADGVLWVRIAEDSQAQMRVFNQNGTQPEMCGNGVRCVALYVADRLGLDQRASIVVDTLAGNKTCLLNWTASGSGCEVAVNMGEIEGLDPPQTSYDVQWGGRTMRGTLVNMGNPHLVLFFDKLPPLQEVDEIGKCFNATPAHPDFNEGINVEFCQLQDPLTLDVIVYERGVGRTLACGTGACAAVVSGWTRELLDRQVKTTVRLPGGPLKVWECSGRIYLQGAAAHVFDGKVALT